MSNVRHRIFVGADVPADVDEVYNPPVLDRFTFDRQDITFDTQARTFDEN